MKIILGVSGSVSAYKSIDLCRELVKDDHQVIVILTSGALEFVNPKIFNYLGAKNVFLPNDDFKASTLEFGPVLHIGLVNWSDRIIVAPLSANKLSQIINAAASDLLTSTLLATPTEVPIFYFPSMNSKMYQHPFTQENLKKLKSLKNSVIIPPNEGILACQEVGIGKLPDIDMIKELSLTLSPSKKISKKVLITTGATISPMDPVRYLTNSSSGKTGFELSKVFLSQGAQVTVIAGTNATEQLDYFTCFDSFTLERASTTQQMEKAVLKYFPSCDIYISAAAISDISFEHNESKIKKSELTSEIKIKKNPDILSQVIRLKKEEQKVIGFAAETDFDEDTLLAKWKKKPVDLLVGNPVHHGLSSKKNHAVGFGKENGDYIFVKDGNISEIHHLSKKQLAQEIFEKVYQ